MKLSIAIITWNRAKQLVDALNSCCHCKLPKDTEFIIIDNASIDDTEEKVKHFFSDKIYSMYYEKKNQNLGVGIGRNYAFSKSNGEYVYFLDDDAYIDTTNKDFFQKAIEILDNHPKIATLTTQIYDLMWKSERVSERGPVIDENLKKCYMFCGGSHFLRRSFFGEKPPYYPNKYGYEEILPSLRVVDAGYINAYISELKVIHNPKVNKWDFSNKKNLNVLSNEIASQYVFKSSFYPLLVTPFNYVAYILRKKKYLNNKEGSNMCEKKKKELLASLIKSKRIRISTLFKLYRYFGPSIF